MAQGVLMPKEGITVESCIMGEWKVNVGDQVNVGDVLFSYETDKAEFECTSTAAGTLLARFYDVQIRVSDQFVLEMHVDTDDANAAGLGNGAQVRIVQEK